MSDPVDDLYEAIEKAGVMRRVGRALSGPARAKRLALTRAVRDAAGRSSKWTRPVKQIKYKRWTAADRAAFSAKVRGE